jgi:hypothetical protein
MTTLARAQLGYDEDFERRLTEAILAAVVETSMIDDCLVIRTGESAAALVTVLASTMALSPSTARSPKAIKQIAECFRKKLMANVRAAEQSPDFYAFKQRTFRNDDRERGGRA